MRNIIDKIFRAAIKLCLLTGVAFTVTACYGVRPDPYPYGEEPDQVQQKRLKMEQKIKQMQDELSEQEEIQ